MNQELLAILIGLVFALLLLWLLRPRQVPEESEGPPVDRTMEIALPRHYRFFPQIQRALSAGDHEYLRRVAPPHIAQKVLRERRAVARNFLRGLSEDFSNLERLARAVASLSPVISRQQETERLLLGLKFRLLYVVVWVRLRSGRVPLEELGHLTELIGRLALRMEQAMAEISTLSADRLTRGLNA